jgi:cysteine desulfurase
VAKLGRDAVRANGHPEKRLPNTLSVSLYGVEANTLLAQIGDKVAASAGAACHADEVEVSAVLAAMDIPLKWAMGTVRLSVGRDTTAEEVDRAVEVIAGAAHKLLPRETMGNLILKGRSDGDGESTDQPKVPS